ncbi:helix-turn-helix transcriptional regulator [Desulfofundulus sp. TPOSR]|uniref:Transcriptional regulator with XRE-family HTH domain n=1 Tax=Desulfofundulus luciae TaxID=74702 RepID=A0ABU0B512_9FIRM|nr:MULTISPECIES: helix-turn-helix transcriptional regulator [Desulfofundulus]MDQ0287802.1 transcriptional regulator with XRE-family HTH domain [Desulfofundulus luciae]NHM28924.1 helix-turn-helix transcriptional regulator [Desulfofundulus sp. TPOSR]
MLKLSARLRELRTSRKISQTALSNAVGVSQRAISYYEAGKDIPTLDVLIRLADFFDISLDYLVGRSDDPRRH